MLDNAALGALNHLLRDSAWARARLTPFAGRAARLSLAPFHLDILVTAEGMLTEVGTQAHDVEITLPAETPLLALRGAEALAKGIHVSGSAEFADALGFVLRNLSWDFEEDLSKVIGDIAAHRIAGLFNGFGAWQEKAARNLVENFAEYLTEENPALVKPSVIAEFSGTVGQLSNDLALLEKRITRLGG